MSDNIVLGSDEELEAAATQPATATEDKAPEEKPLPPKFQNKEKEDIIAMYVELESELGRKGNEVGQLRRLTDQLLGLEKAKAPEAKPERKRITSDELFEDPDKSITERAREIADERAAEIGSRVQTLEQKLLEEAFERKHQGYKQKLEDGSFVEFVRGSPYRQRLLAAAAQNDWDAADELFTAFEEVEQLKQAAVPATVRKTAKDQSLVKSGGSNASGVVGRNDGKKIYSRAELINMRIRNPEEFDERYTTEFLPAYLEGRVK